MCIGFLIAGASLTLLIRLFMLTGIYIGIVDAMGRSLAADLLPLSQSGIGYGVLATANSVGDLLIEHRFPISLEPRFGSVGLCVCRGLDHSRSRGADRDSRSDLGRTGVDIRRSGKARRLMGP